MLLLLLIKYKLRSLHTMKQIAVVVFLISALCGKLHNEERFDKLERLGRELEFVIPLGEGVLGLECEYFNITQCSSPTADCPNMQRTMTCTSEDASTHFLSCYAVWRRSADPELPDVLQYKGCFLNNKECSGFDSCVDRNHKSKQAPKNTTTHIHTHYCCCETDLCNRDYSWEPRPTEASEAKRKELSGFFVVDKMSL